MLTGALTATNIIAALASAAAAMIAATAAWFAATAARSYIRRHLVTHHTVPPCGHAHPASGLHCIHPHEHLEPHQDASGGMWRA